MSERQFDLVVVGSGAAGLSAALRAADLGARVSVLTAGRLLAGSSPLAQGGVAAAVGADDGPGLHAADTFAVGAGLNDRGAVNVLTREAGRAVLQLYHDGMPFEDSLGLEAGHARRRILHAGGGVTGWELTSTLLERARRTPGIVLHDHASVSELSVVAGGQVDGVYVGTRFAPANAVILATGGYAALWGRSTNARETRGTGLGLAWQAGASLADLEFVQFHPTALSLPDQYALLLSEALRGEGARLVDDDDIEVVDPLLPRDVVARALHRHLHAGGRVFLSLQHLDPTRVRQQFGVLAATLRDFAGLDLARDRLPVAPAAHYCMGGIRTDTWGRTNVPGLYAAGEVACSGAQGANRLASNSLLECLVFGARAAEAALNDPPDTTATWRTKQFNSVRRSQSSQPSERIGTGEPVSDGHSVIEAVDALVLGARLDADLGVERDARRLSRLVADLPAPDDAKTTDLLVASLVARSALLRRESRGAHFRTDAPELDPTWRGRIHWRRGHSPAFEEVLS
jgi:L-aspartate oxidase